MDKSRAVELLKIIRGKKVTTVYGRGFEWKTEARDVCSDEGKEAINTAIAALEKAPTALDHIHTVVKDDAYRRGYEQGKADAEKEMHDNILRYRMPEPWKGE